MSLEPKGKKTTQNQSSPVLLYGTEIGKTKIEKHLGIQRSSDGRNRSTIEARTTLARRTAYGLMGAGLHGFNGVSPSVCLKILNTYVIPRLTFGVESLILTTDDLKLLENTYRKYLRCCQHLPESAATPAVYLLSGALPLEGQIHIKTLTFLASMLRHQNSLEREVLLRQVAMKDLESPSWVMYSQSILLYYKLPTVMELFTNPPRKDHWSKLVRDTVSKVWEEKLKEEALKMSSLSMLAVDTCKMGCVHRAWRLEGKSSLEVAKATVKVKLLIQRYPLHSCRTAGTRYNGHCPLCQNQSESIEHFLFHCPAL